MAQYYNKVATLAERWDDIKEYFGNELPNIGSTCLDVGCAEGLITAELSTYFENVYGFDIDEDKVNYAASLNIPNAHFIVEDVVEVTEKFEDARPEQVERFDMVLCLGLLHKLPSHLWRITIKWLLFITKNVLVIRTKEIVNAEIFLGCQTEKFSTEFVKAKHEGQGPLFICRRLP